MDVLTLIEINASTTWLELAPKVFLQDWSLLTRVYCCQILCIIFGCRATSDINRSCLLHFLDLLRFLGICWCHLDRLFRLHLKSCNTSSQVHERSFSVYKRILSFLSRRAWSYHCRLWKLFLQSSLIQFDFVCVMVLAGKH